MHKGHAHGVAAAMWQSLCAGNFTDVRAEISRQIPSHEILCVNPTMLPHVQRLGWSDMYLKTTLTCHFGETSMMRTLGIQVTTLANAL